MASHGTIIAPATPPGVGAIALLRVSGPGAAALTDRLLRKPAVWEHRKAFHRELFDPETGVLLDEAVLTHWKAPRSFTGEETVEIACHGNPFVVQRIVAAYLRLGARAAGPGEFTERAFLNGRIDLTQAEAVADLIAAATDREIAGAHAMRAGRLGERMQAVRSGLVDLLAHLEAHVDFPEEDISPETGARFAATVARVAEEIGALIATAPLGRVLREGVLTAIVGPPNVGKSSLFNALLREDRAIVSPTPGTTRDVIETECLLGGFRLRLLDTAGRREAGDPVEAEGIRRAAAAAARAELLLQVSAAPEAPLPFPGPEPGQRVIRVANKSDLGLDPGHAAAGAIAVSAATGEGLDALAARIGETLLGTERTASADPLTVNTRQESALRAAKAALDEAQAILALRQGETPELASIPLREALHAVGEVVGRATNEDILDALFSKFCIGK